MNATPLDPLDLLAALVAARSPNPPGDERAVPGVVRDAARASRLIDSAAAALRSVLGTQPPPGVLLGVTDSCRLSEAGIPTLPAWVRFLRGECGPAAP